jgi:hypothetical protein
MRRNRASGTYLGGQVMRFVSAEHWMNIFGRVFDLFIFYKNVFLVQIKT